MQIDLHKIIVSQQLLSIDHCKVFLYQILRGKSVNRLFFAVLKTTDSFARTEVSPFSVGHSPRSQGKLILFDFDNATSFVRSLAGQSSSQQRLFTQGKRPLMVCVNFS